VSLLASLLVGAEPVAVRIASQPGTCQLSVEGRAIERLTLADASGRVTPIGQPAGSVSLPAGKYRVQQVELKGGFQCFVFGGSEDDWIHVAPNKSPVLKAGAPLTPKVRVQRGSFEYG
jgi:hypothetical protein